MDDDFSEILSDIGTAVMNRDSVTLLGAQCSLLCDVLRALHRIEHHLEVIASEATRR